MVCFLVSVPAGCLSGLRWPLLISIESTGLAVLVLFTGKLSLAKNRLHGLLSIGLQGTIMGGVARWEIYILILPT